MTVAIRGAHAAGVRPRKEPMNKLVVTALFLPVVFLFAAVGCDGIESTEGESDEVEELVVDGPEADPQVLYKCCWRLPSGECRLRVEAHRACP